MLGAAQGGTSKKKKKGCFFAGGSAAQLGLPTWQGRPFSLHAETGCARQAWRKKSSWRVDIAIRGGRAAKRKTSKVVAALEQHMNGCRSCV